MINLNLLAIGVGIFVGTVTRHLLLQDDYRNYPSYPNGHLIHLTVGFVAASLGSVAVPALLNEDYVAVTFLALAIQQFREVRKMEKESLLAVEEIELIPRGGAYIDGLAKSFEARNYVVLLTSLMTSAAIIFIPTYYWMRVFLAILIGFVLNNLIWRYTQDETIGDIADVKIGKLSVKDNNLFVNNIFLVNIGLQSQLDWVLENGTGIIIKPHSIAASITLSSPGSRQAIIHEVGRILGVRRFYDSRRDFSSEEVGLFIVTMKQDQQSLVQVIKQVPLLESIRRKRSINTK